MQLLPDLQDAQMWGGGGLLFQYSRGIPPLDFTRGEVGVFEGGLKITPIGAA